MKCSPVNLKFIYYESKLRVVLAVSVSRHIVWQFYNMCRVYMKIEESLHAVPRLLHLGILCVAIVRCGKTLVIRGNRVRRRYIKTLLLFVCLFVCHMNNWTWLKCSHKNLYGNSSFNFLKKVVESWKLLQVFCHRLLHNILCGSTYMNYYPSSQISCNDCLLYFYIFKFQSLLFTVMRNLITLFFFVKFFTNFENVYLCYFRFLFRGSFFQQLFHLFYAKVFSCLFRCSI